MLWRERYTPFGEKLLSPGANDNQASFTGHIDDAATGLTYMQARYYDPALGRFLSIDPVEFSASRPDMFNRYAYAANDPVNMIDPDGRVPQSGAKYFLETATPEQKQAAIDSAVDAVAGAAVDAAPVIAEAALNLASVTPQGRAVKGAVEGVKAVARAVAKLGDDALVVRGGTNTADRFTNGTGVTTNADGTLSGVSVNSAAGASVRELSAGIPNNQIGVSTVGSVRAAGGDVIPSPTANNANHCTMCGVTAQQAQELFNPTIRNPNR